MENKSQITPQFILGLIVVFVGVILTMDRLDLLSARDYLRYWPALIIVYGISRIMQPHGATGRGFGIFLTLLGSLLLLDKLEFINFDFRTYWPVILVFAGGSLVWRSLTRSKIPVEDSIVQTDAYVKDFAFWSGIDRKSSSQDFRGGELTAIMGGCELDLRQASIKEGEAVIDVFAFWGGIEIKVPDDWSVAFSGMPFMGGFEDGTRAPKGGSSKKLLIRGNAIMGGVEVSN